MSLVAHLCRRDARRGKKGCMYRVWFRAMIDREADGRFVVSIPDLGDLAAYGDATRMPWPM